MKRKSSSRLGHKLLINRFCCGIKHFTEQNTAAVFSTENKTVYKAEQDCTKVNLEVLFQIHMIVAETLQNLDCTKMKRTATREQPLSFMPSKSS